jgi:hypothetical protein
MATKSMENDIPIQCDPIHNDNNKQYENQSGNKEIELTTDLVAVPTRVVQLERVQEPEENEPMLDCLRCWSPTCVFCSIFAAAAVMVTVTLFIKMANDGFYSG